MICPVCEKEMIESQPDGIFALFLGGDGEWFNSKDPEEIKRISKLRSFQ